MIKKVVTPVGVSRDNAALSLSLQVVVAWYNFLARGLWLVLVVSHPVVEKSTPIPSQVNLNKPRCTMYCEGGETDSIFTRLFPNFVLNHQLN